ncbi:MAG: glycosyl hydrolase family 43 [Clostridia bacterium]|nr:glycosyl hydrolase family 43 [Clostridia bacterium]
MQNLTIEQLLNLEFEISDESPIIKPFGGAPVIADPSLLTPSNSHDGKWHLFCHTTFGVYHLKSDDGISFKKVSKVLNRAMRPNVNYVNGRYYLFYERTRPLIMNGLNFINLAKWKSEIYVTDSTDLITWSQPKVVIKNTRDYEVSERGTSISNPFLINVDGKNRLYYSCGLTYVEDCKFCEPTYVSYAESVDITDGYVSCEEPIIAPDIQDPYLNICSGCLKVYKLADGYLGVQNGLYAKGDKSHSAIFFLTSSDGKKFEFKKVVVEPKVVNGKDWMAQFVYASHLVKEGNTLRLYFNARDTAHPLKGRECIGFASATLKD